MTALPSCPKCNGEMRRLYCEPFESEVDGKIIASGYACYFGYTAKCIDCEWQISLRDAMWKELRKLARKTRMTDVINGHGGRVDR